ncbi:MAG TPA: hypothetical protein DEA51_03745 [Erysipelotrichaceae bacterium]|nr:hypothetical protein [Erysipelotrichaceae bacterium]
MLQEAYSMLRNKKYLMQGLLFFFIFISIYTVIDGFNMSYSLMADEFGISLVVINILLNLIMAGSSALLINLSTIMAVLKGSESKGSNLGFVSVLFGILTYGCTPCIIAFFANIGIAFSVIALPFAGLPYKLVSLLLIMIGLWWTRHEIAHGQCKVKLQAK